MEPPVLFPEPDTPQPCAEEKPLEQPTDAQLDEIEQEDEPAE